MAVLGLSERLDRRSHRIVPGEAYRAGGIRYDDNLFQTYHLFY